MKIAIVAGGFTPGEADKLRRAMATFKRAGTIGTFQTKMIEGMVARGYPARLRRALLQPDRGLRRIRLPGKPRRELRAPRLCLGLAQVPLSGRLRRGAAQRAADGLLRAGADRARRARARRRGAPGRRQSFRLGRDAGAGPRAASDLQRSSRKRTLAEPRVRRACRSASGRCAASYDPRDARAPSRRACGRHPRDPCRPARLPQIKGLREEDARQARSWHEPRRGYDSVRDLWLRTGLSPRVDRAARRRRCLPLARPHAARGAVGGARRSAASATRTTICRCSASLRAIPARERLQPIMPRASPTCRSCRRCRSARRWSTTTASSSLSLRAHPASLPARRPRPRAASSATRSCARKPHGARVTVSGLVIIRQRPGSANGVIFMTIEDETGIANIIVWPKTFERFRPIVLGARYVAVTGELQQESGVIHVVADRLEDLTPLLARLTRGCAADRSARPRRRGQAPARRGHRQPRPRPPQSAAHRRARRLAGLLASDLDVPARGSAHAPSRRGGTNRIRVSRNESDRSVLRHDAVAADIDAGGLERAVRLLHRATMLILAPGLSSSLLPTT